MKITKITVLVIAFAIMVSGVTVFASSNDATDMDYYTTNEEVFSKEDNESSSLKQLPTNNINGVNIAGTGDNYILQEENGNNYQWVGRYYDKKGTGTDAALYAKGKETAFATLGEYVIQSKIKFTQNEDYNMGTFAVQCTDSTGGYSFRFMINGINTLDDTAETILFRSDNGSTNLAYQKNLASIALQSDVWYTFRAIFNTADKTARLEIADVNGNITSTGTVALPSAVPSYENMKFGSFRIDVGEKGNSGFGVDDFMITTKKYVAKIDYESATLKSLPVSNKDNYNVTSTSDHYILEESDGNRYRWIGRFYKKSANTNTDAVIYNEGTKTQLGASGEYVLQTKLKFFQNAEASNIGPVRFLYYNSDETNLFGFGFESLDANDTDADTICLIENNKFSRKTTASFVIETEKWYTVRQIFNIDNNTVRMEMIDPEGNVTSTGDISVSISLTNMKFYWFRIDANILGNTGMGVDDFTIAKTTHKPLTVNYDEEKGGVTMNGIKVNDAEETPVPYNSDSDTTLTVTAKEGYQISDILLNGQSIGKDISDIQLKNVKTAQQIKVTFTEKVSTPSINGTNSDYIFVQPDYKDGYSYVSYYKITLPSDCTLGDYGMYFGLKDGENVKLTARSATSDGLFGIRVYGAAVNDKNEYSFQGFANITINEKKQEYVTEQVIK
ncbi:MAG: hypothetical protein E7399_03505 [Ruminococcaceae bacterium]|nr:hypothetical protein [Oscillospiraceae bacterium]